MYALSPTRPCKIAQWLCASVFVALTGCSVGGPLDAPQPEVARGPGGAASPSDLQMARWAAEGRERAVILALHGYGDAGDITYGDAAQYWASRGITTYAPDQRGFGGNQSRKRWPGAEALARDAVDLSNQIRKRHPGAPIVVVGHSMGGGVALAAAAEGLEADGLVLAGPAIVGGAALSPVYRAGGWVMAATMPERRWTGEGVVEIWPTDNMEALLRASEDPRIIGDPSSRELYGLIRVMDRASAAAPSVTIPTLTLMGARDEILPPTNVAAVHATIPGATDFTFYEDGWHWLFRDLQANKVWSDVADFALSL